MYSLSAGLFWKKQLYYQSAELLHHYVLFKCWAGKNTTVPFKAELF